MALVLADRVRETTTVTGTGTATLLGAVSGYQSFSAVGNANTTYYVIANQSATEWEVGIGTYTASGTLLSRDTVLSSSNSGSLVNFSAGTKDVFVDYPAGRAVYEDAAGNVDGYPITGGTINNTTVGATTPSTGVFTTLGVTTSINASSGSANADLNVNSKGTGNVNIGTGNGTQFRVGDTFAGGTATNFYKAQGTAGGGVVLVADGASTNVQAYLASKGASPISFTTAGVGVEQARVAHTASAVNYVQVTGAATGGAVAVSAQGSDTNIQMTLQSKGAGTVNLIDGSNLTGVRVQKSTVGGDTFLDVQRNSALVELKAASGVTNGAFLVQSKGTGAIDLAAGSSGVNISNGGTVTAFTRTANGSGYTSIPSVAITAPTTAGGVQATASANLFANTATVASGGTGYTNGNVLTVVGGTGGPATYTVTGQSAGAVTSVTPLNFGSYSALPTNPVSVTGGSGSSATLNLTYGISTPTITNAGSGYVEQPTVSFSGGGGSGAAAYATVGSGTIVKSIGSTLSFSTPNGETFRVTDSGATASSYWNAIASGSNAILRGVGGATNVQVQSNSTGGILFGTNSGVTQAAVTHTASAVNYVQVTGSATTGVPTVIAQGSDSSVGMGFATKSANYLYFLQSGANPSFRVTTGATSNYLDVKGGATGSDPVLSAQGSDTNIDLVLSPKGTGALQAQQTDSTATGGNARGAYAVDFQMVRANGTNVASGSQSVLTGGSGNTVSGFVGTVSGGFQNAVTGSFAYISGGSNNIASAQYANVLGGNANTASGQNGSIAGGQFNTTAGFYNFVGGGFTNSGTALAAVTTQSGTMNATTAVTLSSSNANIKVGQYITGTSIAGDTYVAAVSGTSLTLSKVASGSSTSTLSFFTPHGVVVGGGNNQATGAYSFIGGGGDAGTAANRNVASGDFSAVVGGWKNTASGLFAGALSGTNNISSGIGSVVCGGGTFGGITNIAGNTASGLASFVGAGFGNTASSNASFVGAGKSNVSNGLYSFIGGGTDGTTRGIWGSHVIPALNPLNGVGTSQSAILVLAKQTTDATATVLTVDGGSASTTNQVILPNNSAYYFRGEIVSGVTGGGNTKGWTIEGVIKRGANAASTALVGTPTVTSNYADAGASAWTIAVTADTTNGGLAVTFTGQAATTIRTVCQLRTTEMTF